MKAEEVRAHFEETGALLSGHFKLSSGLHSDRYLQCAKVLQWPERAEALGRALAEKLKAFRPVVVVSPAMGGLVIGQEVGRGLGVRAIFAERVEDSRNSSAFLNSAAWISSRSCGIRSER